MEQPLKNPVSTVNDAESPEPDPPHKFVVAPDGQHVKLSDLQQEVNRLKAYIATFPKRPWLETDHPDVIACMGSAPACSQAGCQYVRIQKEKDEALARVDAKANPTDSPTAA